jgi:hypothetical protein
MFGCTRIWLNRGMPPGQQPQYRPQQHQPAPNTMPPPAQNYGPSPADTGQAQPAAGQHDYSFIMEPANPFPKSGRVANGGSPIVKLLLGLGGLFVVIVAFVLIKGIIGGSPAINTTDLVSVLQDQQELIHLSQGIVMKQVGLDSTTVNSALTIELTVTDAQGKLLAYLQTNNQKVTTNQLGLKVSSATDAQVASAQSNGTLDQTYQTIMQGQLTTYTQDLKTAYAVDKGVKGRALLNSDYKAVQLLLVQLTSPSS